MLIRTIVALIVVLLAGCDQKPASPSQSWIERSEKICGPGYLSMKTTSITGTSIADPVSVCIPYKLPDQKP
jgi:hypothetical protein